MHRMRVAAGLSQPRLSLHSSRCKRPPLGRTQRLPCALRPPWSRISGPCFKDASGRVVMTAMPEGSSEAEAVSRESYAIVVAKFNSLITKALLEGAQEAFVDNGNAPVEVYWVPGSFETPLVAKKLAKTGDYAAVVCLGAIIRGGTSHYEAVVSAATSGVLQASMDSETPVIFGVLTCDTMEQALDRAGGKMGNKGYEAAQTAVEMAQLMKRISKKRP